MRAVSAENLSKIYTGGNKAVNDISFCLEKGEIFGFLGPNGSGKSTTQKILTGVLKGYGGYVSLFGKEAESVHTKEFYQKIVWDLIDTVPEDMTELKTLYTSSEQLMEQLERIQSILLEAKNSRESITLSFRQIPEDNPYAVSQLISSVSSSYGVMQIAASSVMSQLLHAGQQPIYACPKSWSQDVLFYAELPGLVLLVSAQAADNGFLNINPVMILTDEPEQIRQQIQTLLAP